MTASREHASPLTWLVWLVCALLVLAYLLPVPYFDALNNPNENVRVYMTRAMVDFGTMAIDPVIAEWGYVNDKATIHGLMYSGKAPGTSYLGIPGYWLYSTLCAATDTAVTREGAVWACRLSGSLLPCVVFLFVFAAHMRTVSRHATVQVTGIVLLGVGSTYYPYAMLFASHSAIAAAMCGAYILMLRHRRSPEAWWIPLLSGFLLGSAVCMEYPAAVGGLILAVWGTLTCRHHARFILGHLAGATPPLLSLIAYHMVFGGPFETPYAHLENPEFAASVSEGFFGLARVQPRALWGSFFAPSNGLFWFMPWSLLAILALVPGFLDRKLRESALLTTAILLSYTVFISMVDNWRGGWTAGPRYIMPVIPFLVLWLVQMLDRAYHAAGSWWWLRLPAYALTVPAVFACSLSALYFPHYPEEIENPIYEISLWFLMHGYLPASVVSNATGDIAGTTVFMLALPLIIWSLMFVASDREHPVARASLLAASLALGLSLVVIGALPGTPSREQLALSRNFVLNLWPEKRTPLEQSLHAGFVPDEVVFANTPEILETAARDAARAGYDQTAIDLLVQAQSLREAMRFHGPLSVPIAGDAPTRPRPQSRSVEAALTIPAPAPAPDPTVIPAESGGILPARLLETFIQRARDADQMGSQRSGGMHEQDAGTPE